MWYYYFSLPCGWPLFCQTFSAVMLMTCRDTVLWQRWLCFHDRSLYFSTDLYDRSVYFSIVNNTMQLPPLTFLSHWIKGHKCFQPNKDNSSFWFCMIDEITSLSLVCSCLRTKYNQNVRVEPEGVFTQQHFLILFLIFSKTHQSAWPVRTQTCCPRCCSSTSSAWTGTGTPWCPSWLRLRCRSCGPGTAGTASSGPAERTAAQRRD